jgi:hypothetical protein
MGRSLGSVSFAEITLAELNAKFQPASKILVSLRFLRANGMGDCGNPIRSNYNNTKAASPEPEITEVSIQEITV